MSEEKIVQATEQDQSLDSDNRVTESNADYESLFNKEISSSKKYRLRAQDAEAKLKGIEESRLAEEGKYKELVDKYKAENKELLKTVDTARSMIEARRGSLLAKLPEEKREIYKTLDPDILEDIVNTVTSTNAKQTDALNLKSTVKQPVKMNKAYEEMSTAERKTYHNELLGIKQ